MPRKSGKETPAEQWTRLEKQFSGAFSHLMSWVGDSDSFKEIRVMARDDGTCLAIAKGYGPDGGPVVCFGNGYGLVASLMAIDRTIQGGHWRVDKPWDGSRKQNEK